jgi:hypothetical protein
LDESGTTSRSIRKFLIYATSFPAFKVAKYLAFVVEPTAVSYLELFQLTTPLFKMNT